MFKNYIKTALRNLLKNKLNSFINIFGLSVGFAASIIIFLYSESELTYNSHFENSDRIYQVYKERQIPTGIQIVRDTWYPMAKALKDDYPEIKDATHIWDEEVWVESGTKKFKETITIAQENIFDVFSFPLAKGERQSVFSDPSSVVISKEIAAKYFGGESPIGKVLTIDYEDNYTVKGVLGEIPGNSSFRPDIMIPSTSLSDELQNEWGSSWLYTYLLLDKGVSKESLEAKFPAFVNKIFGEEGARMNLKLTALPDLYNEVNDSDTYAYILLIVAFAVLLIASINFMNLSTAKSLERALEIGMRKVMGASRFQLVKQYLSETVILSLLALAVGIGLTELILPYFNDMFEMNLSIPYLSDPLSILGLLFLALFVGAFAGLYPAFVLTRFKSVETMRGKFKSNKSGLAVRNTLMIVQFALSVILIIGTGIMRNQISYMKNASLNFDKDNLMIIPVEVSDFADKEAAAQELETFKNELRAYSNVKSVTSSTHVPGRWAGWFTFVYPNDRPEEQRLRHMFAAVDENFFETYGIKILEGENFSLEKKAESSDGVIINKAALDDIGWKSKDNGLLKVGGKERKILAVVDNYHFESLATEVTPIIHRFIPSQHAAHNYVTARLAGSDISSTVDYIADKWQNVDPGRPLDYFFADRNFNQLYETQERLESVALSFTVLGIIIACLGLFALASLMIAQKTKEIGVRKVLGATETSITLMFIRYFAKYVLAAFVIGAPIVYYLMTEWLTDFAYKTEITAGVFIFGGVIVLLVTIATVAFQAIRASLANPVVSLRYE